MVGLTVGLVIVGGAASMFVANVQSSRRLLVEARVSQDLRAAADVVARELRRAGYWENAIAGTVTTSTGVAATTNLNAVVTADAANSQITYSVARDTAATRCVTTLRSDKTTTPCTDNTLQTDEQFGFRLNGGVLQMQIGSGNWQPLTDSTIETINTFSIAATATPLDSSAVCTSTCTGSTCPTVTVRSYALVLQGTATSDSNVVRVLKETVRVRNDAISGSCPP
jgi:type IV pilus assembly protein PilW